MTSPTAPLRYFRGRDGAIRAHRPSCTKSPASGALTQDEALALAAPVDGPEVKAATCCKPTVPGQTATGRDLDEKARRKAGREAKEATAHARILDLNERLHRKAPAEADPEAVAVAHDEAQAAATPPPAAEAAPEAEGPRLDRKTGAHAWQIALWAKGQGPLVDGLIDEAFAPGAQRPHRQDDHWLRVSSQAQASALIQAAEQARPEANEYATWLLDLLICQLRQAYPAAHAPEIKAAWNKAAGALNTLRAGGALTDWRAWTPPGLLLTFRIYLADGTTLDLRPRAAWAWVSERAAIVAAPEADAK